VTSPDPQFHAFLSEQGLVAPGASVHWTHLTGGVSSEIWKAELPTRAIVIKRALERLKVEAEWIVPTARNEVEWAWLAQARRCCPDAVPALIAHDPLKGLFAMEYLDPDEFPCWRDLLDRDILDFETADRVGARLVMLHAAAADDAQLLRGFDHADLFHALRLDPYLLTTARRHPDLAVPLSDLAARTANTRRTLIHGDISPKNILIGPRGPVFLDAECATHGDPAFDLAFCLALMLLGCVAHRGSAAERINAARRMTSAYLRGATWESADGLEERAAALLPGLLLARIDGKSPVQDITLKADRIQVRTVTGQFLRQPARRIEEFCRAWAASLRA
jgi:aminoglycoside phosphotransferase (APT) family kinase protein